MKRHIFALGTALMLAAAGCSDNDTDRSDWIDFGEGRPFIEKVVDPAAENAVIDRAPTGKPLKIIGRNLYSVDKATINGVDASNYIAHIRDVMYLVVPKTAPEAPTGKLVIENKWGSAEIAFETYIAQ